MFLGVFGNDKEREFVFSPIQEHIRNKTLRKTFEVAPERKTLRISYQWNSHAVPSTTSEGSVHGVRSSGRNMLSPQRTMGQLSSEGQVQGKIEIKRTATLLGESGTQCRKCQYFRNQRYTSTEDDAQGRQTK
jgi:hypothetical protein